MNAVKAMKLTKAIGDIPLNTSMQLTNKGFRCVFAVMRSDESLPLITNDTSGACNTSVEVKKHACSAKRDKGMIEGGAKGQ